MRGATNRRGVSDTNELSAELEEVFEHHSERQSGRLEVSDGETYVGDTVTIRGADLPERESLDLVWHSSEGQWAVLEANEVIGPQYSPRTETIGTVTTDESGTFEETWTVFEDYGGSHLLEAQTSDGETVAEAKLEIRPWFDLYRTEAPLGEAFTVIGYGLGPNFVTNNYQVTWDNSVVGFMTGVQNRGTATARVRAVGPPGEHVLRVWRNYYGVPYLQNDTQSPFGSVAGDRQSTWTVTVTEPETEPEPAWVDPLMDERPLPVHYPDLDEDTDAELEVTPECGQVGTEAVVTGRNFPANTEVDLVWYRHEGEHALGEPVTAEPKPDVLPTVTADADGRFQIPVTIPECVGATRPITANVDGKSVAVTGFMVQPTVMDISPTKGPVGTEIEIELSGIGWTEYETAPFFVYDNAYLGYVCGQDIPTKRTVIEAAGEPGYHFIDVYPSFFPEVDADELDFSRKPHLSYIDNHPVRALPALHFAFEVTE